METNVERAIWRQAEFEEARDRAQAGLDDINDLLAERETRGAPAAQWTPPEPAAPVQRQRQPAAPRPQPEPAPPIPSKVMHTRHDAAGRVIEVVSYEGSAAVATVSWENWIKQYVARQIHDFAGAFGEGIAEVENELGEKRRIRFEAIERQQAEDSARIAEQAAQIEALLARLQQLETRTAGPPRLVESSDAAD